MSQLAKQYFENVIQRIQRLADEQMPAIDAAAELLADAVVNGQRIFAFGCTHSSLPIQDLVYRAGGLMLINPIYAPGLEAMTARPATLSTSIERISGFAAAILDHQPIQRGDVLIVVSVSGRQSLAHRDGGRRAATGPQSDWRHLHEVLPSRFIPPSVGQENVPTLPM